MYTCVDGCEAKAQQYTTTGRVDNARKRTPFCNHHNGVCLLRFTYKLAANIYYCLLKRQERQQTVKWANNESQEVTNG